jgi:XTP/dITP diphosphohydrolase
VKSLYFATTSPTKMEEATFCLTPHGIEVVPVDPGDLPEVLSIDLNHVSRQKTLLAFKTLRLPLFCEHGALSISALDGLPGTLSKIFFDTLGDRLCDIIPPGASREAFAQSAVTYCDGRRLHTFAGEVSGLIPTRGRGPRKRYYDSVFSPTGRSETFAEMSLAEKMPLSHVRIAYDQLARHVASETP